MTAQNGANTPLTRPGRVFPRPFTHEWGDKALMGGTHEGGLMRGDIDLMGGIDYIIN